MKENYFLAKWLNGEINDEELKKNVSEEEIRAYKKIISTTKNLKTPYFDQDKALEQIKSNKKSKVKKLNTLTFAYRAAAILVLTFSTYYFLSNKNTSIETQLAEKITFELPDNSTVNLNTESQITFKEKNWNNTRTLNLEGEAYFKVKKGSKFSVTTDLGIVQVLGTQFNVQARDSYFEVVCYEGLVSVKYNNESIQLPAGSSIKILNSKAELSNNNTDLNPSWIQNKSTFNSIPFKLVVEELERQFDIQIEFDLKNENTLYTGSFTHTNLDTALKAITIPLNLNFTIFNNKKVKLD